VEPEARKSQTRTSYLVIDNLFFLMAMGDGAAVLRAIAAAGLDVNVAGPTGKTLLMRAVHFAAQCDGKLRRKMVEGISCLLHHGANPNLADERGLTAFTSALKLGQRDIAELLFLSSAKFRSRIH
jgi:ankyrin repeat protein